MQKPKKKLSICLYSPYIPNHFGGGERYLFSVASYLSRYHAVSVAITRDKSLTEEDQQLIRSAYQQFFSLDLANIQFISTPIGTSTSFLKKLWWTKKFDVLYAVTDGSLFFSLARKNVLHIQFPFTHPLNGLINRLKLSCWPIKNTNSAFTKKFVESAWDTTIDVIHTPFVDTDLFQPAEKKEKIILAVGRFFTHLHSKKQDVMVKAFKKMIDQYPQQTKGWKFVLIGGVEDEEYAKKVSDLSAGYPIKILHSVSEDVLRQYFAKSKLYWHATGYGVDEFLEPKHVEHFGITTLEAMSSGCVPIVINKGGQKEIVEPGVNGFLWNEPSGLIEKTMACITKEVDTAIISEKAIDRAQEFNKEVFYSKLNKMLGTEHLALDYSGKVSVVIPNFNGRTLMQKHLSKVIQAMEDEDELVIVDDASTDDSVQWAKQRFSLEFDPSREHLEYDIWQNEGKWFEKKITVTLVTLKKNSRFALACNIGVDIAMHELIWLLNTDVSPHIESRKHLVKHFLDRKKNRDVNTEQHYPPGLVFAVSCLEHEKDEAGKEILGGKNTLWFSRGLFQHSRATDFKSGETAWAPGGSAMFDKLQWQEIGGFSLQYQPAYWEDIDLSYRAQQKGWVVLFEPKAEVDHNHESTNSKELGHDRMQVVSVKNGLQFLWNNGTVWQKIQCIFWLPYHLLKTNKKMNGVFVKGLWEFVRTIQ